MTVLRTEKILLTPFLSISSISLYLKHQANFYSISTFIILIKIYIYIIYIIRIVKLPVENNQSMYFFTKNFPKEVY